MSSRTRKTRAFVGTSGWYYDWNEDKTLDWYVARSGLNAVELNASFYRFPFPNMVKSWTRKGKALRWAVKVNRLVTHIHRFNEKAEAMWKRFAELFLPLDPAVDFYLFQLHPALGNDQVERIADFARRTGLGRRFALEPRNESWFCPKTGTWARKLGITLVSIDAPEFSREVVNTSGLIYLRMHGRTGWYRHDYRAAELREVAKRIRTAMPRACYVFFNNDEHMLPNARAMLRILSRQTPGRSSLSPLPRRQRASRQAGRR